MKRKILFTLICSIIILAVASVSYAAVEIVPSKNGLGTDSIVNTTISNSYMLCQNMKNVGESLYGTTVLPHLATNKDWGAVSYLSNSIYGTNGTGGNTGVEVTIDGVKYYSTTNNITGVMNWGSNPNKTRTTQTSGIILNDTDLESNMDNVIELYNNKDSKYVEAFISTEWGKVANTLGMATYEVDADNIGMTLVSIRSGLYGMRTYWGVAFGQKTTETTFRPVVWNK